MAGLGMALAYMAGGAAEGVGASLVEQAKARRDAALRKMEMDDQRSFITSERTASETHDDKRDDIKAKRDLDLALLKTDKPANVQEYEYAIKQLREKGVPEDKLPTYQEFAKPKSRGISFRGPDGTEIQIGGEEDGSTYSGTSLPAEVGARIGLGDSFIKNDYPEIIKMIDAGDATGIVDYAKGVTGRGNSGIVQRRMASGADALRRGLTGAGMSVAESEEYAKRYLPQITDNAETLRLKAEGLKTDLEAVTAGAIKGKAGDVGGFLPSTTKDKEQSTDGGWQDVDGVKIRRKQ